MRAAPGYTPRQHLRRLRAASSSATRSRVGTRRWSRCSTDGRRYTSGAQWLDENLCCRLATRSPSAARTARPPPPRHPGLGLLQAAGRDPGFLIGGVAEDFGPFGSRVDSGTRVRGRGQRVRHRLLRQGREVRHLPPLVGMLNNVEFDHADIFPDVAAIQRQFHHLVRTVPRRGRLIVNGEDAHLSEVLAMGCWTPVETSASMPACCPRRRPAAATATAPTSVRPHAPPSTGPRA